MNSSASSKESTKTDIFTTINDDCLHLIIFDYLKLEDQFVLCHVCHKLREFILTIWKRKWSSADLRTLKLNTYKRNVHVAGFIFVIADFCEKITLDSFQLTSYENVFRACSFPKLNVLNAYLLDEELKADEQVFLISVLFPNITKLKLNGRLLGNYIYRLKNLKELHLELGNKRICFIHAERFLKNLSLEKFTYNSTIKDGSPFRVVSKCLTLKELSTNCCLTRFDRNLQTSFRNIRKITFTDQLYSTSIPRQLSSFNSKQIKRLVLVGFTKSQELLAYSEINYMTDLRQIILSEMIYLNAMQLSHIVSIVPKTLVKFRYLKSSWSNEVEDKLVLLIRRCNNLKVLDVSDTTAGLEFLHKLLKQVDFKKHKQNLLLHCFNTNIVPNFLELLNLPKNLEVSFEKINLCLPEFGSFQIVREIE